LEWDLKDAAIHNTVTFNGEEPMAKFGRFLFLPWPSGRSEWDGANRFTSEHDGWSRIGCRHIRSVEASGDDEFVITDQLITPSLAVARVHWLLPDLPYRLNRDESSLVLEAPQYKIIVDWEFLGAEVEVVRAAPDVVQGWWSPCYFNRQPALSLSLMVRCSGSVRGWTRFRPIATAA
jgi:hypothetical protein